MEISGNDIASIVFGAGSIGGLIKLLRQIERLDARVTTEEKNVTALWEKVNDQQKDIDGVGKDLAEERGLRKGQSHAQ